MWQSYADNELAAHHVQQAAALYRKALDLDPDEPVMLNTLGYTEALAGNLGAAVKALEDYQRIRPGEANPLDSLGDIYYHFGRMEEAEKYYREAFEKAPEGQGQLSLMKAAQAHLWTGDVAGADAVFRQFLEGRKRAGDSTVTYREAVWNYLSGRRAAGIAALEALAHQTSTPQLAAQAEGQLAVWYLERGDRSRARESAEAAGEGTLGAVVRFLTAPPASASEWAVRAERTFPAPAQERLKNVALGYALLLNRDFAAATPLWRQLYRQSSPLNLEDTQVLLAWALVETNRWDDVEDLIQANPFPQAGGPTPFACMAFPRILALRARLYSARGKSKESAQNQRLYRLLSGDRSNTMLHLAFALAAVIRDESGNALCGDFLPGPGRPRPRMPLVWKAQARAVLSAASAAVWPYASETALQLMDPADWESGIGAAGSRTPCRGPDQNRGVESVR